jgi:hypothetical protein
MKIPNEPSYDTISKDFEPILHQVLYPSLEDAIQKTNLQFLEWGKEGPDRQLFPHLVRYFAKDNLDRFGLKVEMEEKVEVEETEEPHCQFNFLPNNGLSGTWKGYNFRILMSEHGELPIPASHRKIDFYNQQLPLALLFETPLESLTQHVHLNILFLWEVDIDYHFIGLRLACPRTGGKNRASVSAYFNELIPHPATTLKEEPTQVESQEEIEITIKKPERSPEHSNDIR